MKIAVVGYGEEGKALAELLTADGGEYELCRIAEEDSSLWGLKTVNQTEVVCGSPGRTVQLYREGQIDKWLIPSVSENPNGWSLADKLRQWGVPEQDFLYAPVEIFRDPSLSAARKLRLICAYDQRRELDFIEMHAADHCNLNCRYCSMFSGLVEHPVFPDYEETARGIRGLKRCFDHVKVFRVLGGEPLLNPELDRYLTLIRDTFPYTDIRLITNGLLVTAMPERLLTVLRQARVSLIVTTYPATVGLSEEIQAFLSARQIRHVVTPAVMRFQMIYNGRGDSDPAAMFSQCNWRGTCANLKGERLAACFVPFVLPYLTKRFGLPQPEEQSILLSESGLTAASIRERLERPMEACRFCAPKGRFVKWERTDAQSVGRLADWAEDEREGG